MQHQLQLVPPDQIHGQMNNGLSFFKEEAEVIRKDYPELEFSIDNDSSAPILSGTIKLEDSNGITLDTYKVKILPTLEYPSRFPFVFETENRIPINIDWHVYPDDGHFCFCSIPEEILICKNRISLSWFIENQIKPYLFNQKYREMHGFFLKERPHGNKGNVQFFMEELNTNNYPKLLQLLYFIKERHEPNRVQNCFCGSGKKYRHCHRCAYRKLSQFTDIELNQFIQMIYSTWQAST